MSIIQKNIRILPRPRRGRRLPTARSPIVVVIGAILALLGMAGHAVGGRRHYF